MQDKNSVNNAPAFETIALPVFDIETIVETLAKDLPTLNDAAEAQVQAHLKTLGQNGESWVSDGVARQDRSGGGTCPFFGQDLSASALFAHYRDYFNEEYTQLKQAVANLIKEIEDTHGRNSQLAFQRSVNTANVRRQFWVNYSGMPLIELGTEKVVNDWSAALQAITGLLEAKQAAPLEKLELNQHALDSLTTYDEHREQVKQVSDALLASNATIKELKNQVDTGNMNEANAYLNTFKATKARYRPDILALCDSYLQEKQAKTQTEEDRDEARNALNKYRVNAFPKLETAVNVYLQRFNAGFRIGKLTSANIGSGSGSTSTYNVVINDTPVNVRNSGDSAREVSFRNTLSAGDRNALALAFFFSSLDQDPNLGEKIVVIDDPMSSLDDHRSLTTVQEVRKLTQRAAQVIVLSHNKRFLCGIWSGADRKECLAMEIVQTGDESTIRSWDVSQDSITEHDQRCLLLMEYEANQTGSKKEIAAAIRPHLEGFLRVACPSDFPPGKQLGHFTQDCLQKIGTPKEVMTEPKIEELRNIIEFGNSFHHDTNPAWESEEINDTELLGFVPRTLSFVSPAK